MEKYKVLIGKKINLEFNGTALNSYKITEMLPTDESMEGRGKMFKCSVDWEKKELAGAEPTLSFDEQTLDELIETGKSVCPLFSNLHYKIAK
jgi:hypothetical protein